MGRLLDSIKRNNEKVAQKSNENIKQQMAKKYNHNWLYKVATNNGYTVGHDDKKVEGILDALNRRDGQCPCGGDGIQFKCPCHIMRENDICKCGLFETLPDRKISGSSTAEISKSE